MEAREFSPMNFKETVLTLWLCLTRWTCRGLMLTHSQKAWHWTVAEALRHCLTEGRYQPLKLLHFPQKLYSAWIPRHAGSTVWQCRRGLGFYYQKRQSWRKGLPFFMAGAFNEFRRGLHFLEIQPQEQPVFIRLQYGIPQLETPQQGIWRGL